MTLLTFSGVSAHFILLTLAEELPSDIYNQLLHRRSAHNVLNKSVQSRYNTAKALLLIDSRLSHIVCQVCIS